MTLSKNDEAVSQAFVSARLAGAALDGFPGDLPADLSAAYAVQANSVSAWPDDVVGWKVGGIPSPYDAEFGEARLAGPIFSRSVQHVRGEKVETPVFENGFAAVEAEYVLVLGEDIAPGSVDGTVEAARRVVSDIHVGVEMASSPLSVINELGPLSIISDFGNNAGLIVGPKLDDWRSRDLGEIGVKVEIDGNVVGEAKAGSDAPFQAVAFLIDLSARRGLTLPKGTFVSTGAVTGVHSTQAGATSTVTFDGIAVLDLHLVPAAEINAA